MFFKKKKAEVRAAVVLPEHIAIIMDGNGRWAKKRNLPRSSGHTAGAANFKTITRYAASIGVKYLTMYAFSTENWKRPQDEIGALMKLFQQYLREALDDFLEENIKVRFIGDVSVFPKELKKLIREVEEVSENRTGMVLNLAMNYGGRKEILRAFENIREDLQENKIQEVTEETVAEYLYTNGQPDPDLIIRPSGEQRLSNFLLWQSAYSEFVYFDILWPDFTPENLMQAIDIYSSRQRRFGGI
nr:isoprenyl transferase [Scatolibacter rhodanostii]